jgi:CHASE2 domain-containing sensor protein
VHTTNAVRMPSRKRPILPWATLVGFVWALACAVLTLSARRKPGFAALLPLLLLVAAGAGLASCGGGGYAAPAAPQLDPTSGTSAGTYPITVTATSTSSTGSLSHSTTVTLTVM